MKFKPLITILVLLLILLGISYMWRFTKKTNQISQAQAEKIALEYVKTTYNAIDPQPMNSPETTLKNGRWIVTIIDISAKLPPSGNNEFILEIDAGSGKVLKVEP